MTQVHISIYIMLLIFSGLYIVFMSMRSAIESKKIQLFLPFLLLAMGLLGMATFLIRDQLNKDFLDFSIFLGTSFLVFSFWRMSIKK